MKLGKSFINDIRELIRSARSTVARGVDLVQVHTNFEIGRRIFEQEQKGQNRAAYGKQVVKALAEQLTAEFGSGFSKRNLDYFRRFYLEYANRRARIVQTTSAQSASSEKSQTLSDPSQIFPTLSGELPAGQIVQTASGQSADLSRFPPRPFTLSWSHFEARQERFTFDEDHSGSSSANRETKPWWKSLCRKGPTSMPASTSSICPARRNCGGSSSSGPLSRESAMSERKTAGTRPPLTPDSPTTGNYSFSVARRSFRLPGNAFRQKGGAGQAQPPISTRIRTDLPGKMHTVPILFGTGFAPRI